MNRAIVCAIFGDSGSGKTSFQAFHSKSSGSPTRNILQFKTNIGEINIDTECEFYDIPKRADVALIFVSNKNKDEYALENVNKYCGIIRNKYGNIHIIVCGTFIASDHKSLEVSESTKRKIVKDNSVVYYDIDNKSSYNCEEAILSIIRNFFRDEKINFS